MSLKAGLVVGFGVGYVLGAKAGHERYEQIERAWARISSTPAFEELMRRGSAVLSQGLEAGRGTVSAGLTAASDGVRQLADRPRPRTNEI